MRPKISAKTVEGNLSRSDTVEIEFLGVTRVFIQQKISGAGLNCLWRSVAASYYGSQNRWNDLHRRARDLYAAATSDAAVYLGSPLQTARRELYENISTMASDFLPRLADGKWGDMDHVQIIADVLDVEIIAYTFDVTEDGDLRWGVTVRGNHQPPNRQVHIVNYQGLLHWQVLTPTDIDAEDEDKINDMDWQLFIDPIHMRPTVLGDVGRLARLPLGHARYNDHTLTAKDQGHVADDRCPNKAEQLRAAAVEKKAKEAKAAAEKEKLAQEVTAVIAAVAKEEAKEAAAVAVKEAKAGAAAKEKEAREAEAAAAKERKAREVEAAAMKEKKAREAKAVAAKDKEAKSKATAAAAKEKKDETEAAQAERKKKIMTDKIKAEAREKNKAEAVKKQQEAEAAEEEKRVQAAKERDNRAKAAENRKAKAEEEQKKTEAKKKKENAKAIEKKKKDEAAKKKQKASVTAAKKKTEAVDKVLAKMAKEVATERKKQENKKKPVKKSSKKKATLAAVKPVPGEPASRLKRKRGVEATEQGVSKKRK